MSNDSAFEDEVRASIDAMARDDDLKRATLDWMVRAGGDHRYSYNFTWMGRPIIQYPQDIVGLQELIWRVRPDLIVEMGIAHGGSLIFNASMLALLDYDDAVSCGTMLDPASPGRRVLGVDIDIRQHNRAAIESHPMASRIEMIEGSSIDPQVVAQVRQFAADYATVMVILDSNHTHEHVLAELEAYASLATVGSYCIVFDTLVEDVPEKYFENRPWGKGDNPKTAVREFLHLHAEFELDKEIETKLLITVAPDGFLRRRA